MAWTKAEKELVDERFTRVYDAVESNARLNEEHFKNLEGILKRIETQTTRTNGRVTTLEDKEARHTINCPQAPKISRLEQRAQKYYLIEKYPAAFIVGGVVFALLTIIGFLGSLGIIGA